MMSWNNGSKNRLEVNVKRHGESAEYCCDFGGEEGFFWLPQRTMVSVTGPFELMVKRTIQSLDRFCEYDEGDLAWALPLKLCRVTEEWPKLGEIRKLSEFAGQDYFYKDHLIEADILCVSMNVYELGPRQLMELEFEVIGQLQSYVSQS